MSEFPQSHCHDGPNCMHPWHGGQDRAPGATNPPRMAAPPKVPLAPAGASQRVLSVEQEIRAHALAAAAATLAATAVRPLTQAEASTRRDWVVHTAQRFATYIETGE